jgi:hypothetical protein
VPELSITSLSNILTPSGQLRLQMQLNTRGLTNAITQHGVLCDLHHPKALPIATNEPSTLNGIISALTLPRLI